MNTRTYPSAPRHRALAASTALLFSAASWHAQAMTHTVDNCNDSGPGPHLGSLRDNGGPTKTHALLSGSPGIDAGNDSANVQYDQRLDPNVRDNGPPDIGAYEVQPGIIFNASFEGCAPLP